MNSTKRKNNRNKCNYEDKLIIKESDPKGTIVTCTTQVFKEHISVVHPIMKDNISAIVETIGNPDKIFDSIKDVDSEIYIKHGTKTQTYDESLSTIVVTKFIGSSTTSEIVTAWPAKKIGNGVNNLIYEKHKED